MSTPEQRAAFRAFVRAHHPDRGGDPERFVEGLDRLRAVDEAAAADPLPFPVRVGVALIRTWRRRHEGRPDGR
jgi:hypothetical protein